MGPKDSLVLSKELLDSAMEGGFVHCKHIHKHSCNYNAFLKLCLVARDCSKFYAMVHLVPVLVFKTSRITTQ